MLTVIGIRSAGAPGAPPPYSTLWSLASGSKVHKGEEIGILLSCAGDSGTGGVTASLSPGAPAIFCPRCRRTAVMMYSSSQDRVNALVGEHGLVGDAEAAAAWSARYHEYVQHSIAQAGRAQDLNREVLRRVAAGQLAPWTIESHLSAFAATRAASYSQQITDLTMAFLAGLIQTGSTYCYELVQALLPGTVPVPEAVIPDFNPARPTDWFADLTAFAAGESARAAAMVRDLMNKAATGEVEPADVDQSSSKFHAAYLPESTTQLVDLYLDLLTGLENVRASFGEECLRTLIERSPGAAERRESAVEINAFLDEATSIRFAVTNRDPQPAAVACTLSGIRRADGIGPAFDPVVSTTPRRLDLAPGAEAAVELTIHADADHFQSGESYEGVFRVASATRTLLEFPLVIRALARESAGPPPTARPGPLIPEPDPPASRAEQPQSPVPGGGTP